MTTRMIMSHSLNSLSRVIEGIFQGSPIGVMKGDTRSLDYGSMLKDESLHARSGQPFTKAQQSARSLCLDAEDKPYSGLLLRNLIQVTILGKPYSLRYVYTHTHYGNLI